MTVSMFPAPAVPLRYYQRDALAGIEHAFGEGRSALVAMATGMGKTRLFVELAAQWSDRDVLILAHRKELIRQAASAIEARTGEAVEIDQAENRAGSGRIVVASIDTIRQERRLKRYPPGRFGLIIADEAHHYTAKEWRKPLDYFARAKLLGVTATPDRGDQTALGKVFERCAYQMDISDGIEAGYLVPVRGVSASLEGFDVSDVKKRAGDLPSGILDEKVLKVCHAVVSDLQSRLSDGRQVLAFFPGVRSAAYAAELWNRTQPGTAAVITGTTDADERAGTLREFRAGRLQLLANCAVLTEGIDLPATSVIAIARPTLSRALYTQMVGRGTRPHVAAPLSLDQSDAAGRRQSIADSTKPSMLLIDYAGTAGKHSLVGPADVLGGKFSDQERKRAKVASSAGEVDVAEALRKARAAIKAEALKDRVTKGQVSHAKFNPFRAAAGVLHLKNAGPVKDGPSASDAQRSALYRFGVPRDVVNGLGKREASAVMNSLVMRSKRGLATYPQLAVLKRAGYNKVNITRATAATIIDATKINGWKLPPEYARANA